jgi:tetrahydromethanopterin S-methyltransferase subunit H
VDAGVHAVASLLSDFLLYGPLSGTSRVFPAVAAAHSMLGALRYEETGVLPPSESPLNLMFPDVVAQFKKEKGAN